MPNNLDVFAENYIHSNTQVGEGTGVIYLYQKIDGEMVFEVCPYENYAGSDIAPRIFSLSAEDAEFFHGMAIVQCIFFETLLEDVEHEFLRFKHKENNGN